MSKFEDFFGAGGLSSVLASAFDTATQVDVSADFPSAVFGPSVATALAPMPMSLASSATARIANKLYVYGGWQTWGVTVPVNVFYEYDINTDTWTTLTVGAPVRTYTQLVAVGTDLYLLDGLGPLTTLEPSIWKYNTLTSTWSQIAASHGLPVVYAAPFVSNTAVMIGTNIYYIRAISGGQILVKLDTTTNTFTSTPYTPTAILNHLVAVGTSLVGFDMATLTKWTYDTLTSTWSSIVFTYADIGGAIDGPMFYDIASNTIRIISSIGGGTEIYVWLYDITTNKMLRQTGFTKFPSAPNSYAYFFANLAPDGSIIFGGGAKNGSTIHSAVTKYNPVLDVQYKIVVAKG